MESTLQYPGGGQQSGLSHSPQLIPDIHQSTFSSPNSTQSSNTVEVKEHNFDMNQNMLAYAALQFDADFGAEESPTPVTVFKQFDLNNDVALITEEISSQGEEAKKMMEDQDKVVEETFANEDKDKEDKSVQDPKLKMKVKLVDSFDKFNLHLYTGT